MVLQSKYYSRKYLSKFRDENISYIRRYIFDISVDISVMFVTISVMIDISAIYRS